jgi:hypothetical protein
LLRRILIRTPLGSVEVIHQQLIKQDDSFFVPLERIYRSCQINDISPMIAHASDTLKKLFSMLQYLLCSVTQRHDTAEGKQTRNELRRSSDGAILVDAKVKLRFLPLIPLPAAH